MKSKTKFDLFSYLLGLLSGLVIAGIGAWISQTLADSREAQKIARLLLHEVSANQTYLKTYTLDIDEEGRIHKDDGELLPFMIEQIRWPKPSYLRTTIFSATLRDHGLLQEETFKELHKFYWNIQQVERFVDWSGDPTSTTDLKVSFARDIPKIASHALEQLDSGSLIDKLDQEAKCGFFCRIFG